VLTQERA